MKNMGINNYIVAKVLLGDTIQNMKHFIVPSKKTNMSELVI